MSLLPTAPLTMPLTFCSPRACPSVVHHVHRARVCVPPIRSLYAPARTKFAFAGEQALLFSALWNRSPRTRRFKTIIFHKERTLHTLCGLQEGLIADEPSASRKWPSVQWVLAAAAVGAGLIIFGRLKGGLTNLSTLDADPGLVTASPEGLAKFNVNLPGFGKLSLGEVTPGWVYFLLLMAAGFGLFVSEEALNVWVGASLSRLLTYESQEAFYSSLSANAPYIISTILWVYWGVCISDMVPFFAGKLASKSGDQLSKKLGVSQERYEQVTGNIQQFGNLIGFVERFSVGIRNPTSFLAGVAGISPARFFAGVCLGGLFTLPIQMSIGFFLRERPVTALAGVAAIVGAWTVFPYVAAALVSFFYLQREKTGKPSQ